MPAREFTDAAIAQEQVALDVAMTRREAVMAELTARLSGPVEEASVAATAKRSTRTRLYELERADSGLVFGRLDALDGTVWHIGRVGVPAQDDLDDPLVLDWRAAAARPFYTATAVEPQGQARRRHIRTEDSRVVGVDDEVLYGTGDGELVGEGALLAALDERRTGRMGTAVATLQKEQDEIVRAPARGALVVQGGPGTGKTVVALHRVAYLLFAHPELARAGVLVLGPSERFLDYIGSVLPALGETAVVSATCPTLLPGVRPERRESRRLAEIKGRAGGSGRSRSTSRRWCRARRTCPCTGTARSTSYRGRRSSSCCGPRAPGATTTPHVGSSSVTSSTSSPTSWQVGPPSSSRPPRKGWRTSSARSTGASPATTTAP